MISGRSVHGFVDESKYRGYYMAITVLAPHRLASARRDIRGLRLRGQERVHFSEERSTRRREIVQTICRLDAELWIYDGSNHDDDRNARTSCLRHVVSDLAAVAEQRLVIEQDDSLVAADRADLWAAVRRAKVTARLTYEHLPPRSEPLLWVPDATAWCWAHGGSWQSSIEPTVSRLRAV